MKQGNFGRTFSFRLNETDRARLEQEAAARDLRPGALARKIVSNALALKASKVPERRQRPDAKSWTTLLTELARQGNNLNQIAAAFNSGTAPASISASLKTVIARQSELLDEVMAFLKPRRGPGLG